MLGSQPGVTHFIKAVGMEPRRDSKLLFNSSPDVQRTGIPTRFLLFHLSATKKGAPKYGINLWRKVTQRITWGDKQGPLQSLPRTVEPTGPAGSPRGALGCAQPFPEPY